MAEAKKSLKAKKSVAKAEDKPVEATEEKLVKVETTEAKADKPTAKAGKRSAKAQAETQAEEIKKARVAVAEKPKQKSNPPRTRLERAGKKYKDAAKLIDKTKQYTLAEAVDLATKTSTTKFDASVELHIRLNVDPKQADQNIRGTVSLPSGTGKTIKVATLTEDDKEQIFAKLDKEQIDFDVLITTPSMMPKLAKYAKLLGPKGLMPNPKSGTVTSDLAKAAEEAKSGKVEYRVDQAGIIHLSIGKISQGADKLLANAEAINSAVRSAKPASVKGIYVRSAFVSSTMGPSIKVTA